MASYASWQPGARGRPKLWLLHRHKSSPSLDLFGVMADGGPPRCRNGGIEGAETIFSRDSLGRRWEV